MKEKLKQIFIIVIMTLLVSCGNNSVKIGAILPETGDMSGLGTSMRAGLELALEEINEKSDVKFELVVADAPSSREVVNAYNALRYKHKVKFFITAGSSYSMILKPFIIQNNEILFCVASLPDITKNGEYNVFKIGNSSIDESIAITNYLLEKGKDENVVLFYPNSEYGIPFYNTINGEVASCSCFVYNEDDRDFKNIITLALKEKPTKVVAIGETPALGNIIKELRTMGYHQDIISNTMFTNSNVITSAGESSKGVIYVDYNFDRNAPTTRKRDSLVQNKYHVSFSSISFLAYSIPFFLNNNCDIIYNKELGEASILQELSSKIRNTSPIYIAEEYPYIVMSNGDIKPSLTLRKYE